MFITLLSKFEIFIGTLLTTKNNPLTMSCSPDCVEFMEKCYEEQEQEQEQSDEEPEIYTMPRRYIELKMLLHLIDRPLDTVAEAKRYYKETDAMVQDLLEEEDFAEILMKNMNAGETTSKLLLEQLKHMFSDPEVFKVSLMMSEPFPLYGLENILSKWLLKDGNIREFLLATKRERALNFIGETLRMCCLLETLIEAKKQKDYSRVEKCHLNLNKLGRASKVHILPLIINIPLTRMFHNPITRIERNKLYKDVKMCLERYHEALEVLEDCCSEGDYLMLSQTVMRSFKEQKKFISYFQEDGVGNVVDWDCGDGDLKLDFTTNDWTIAVLEQ